jgi:hypothetical protein
MTNRTCEYIEGPQAARNFEEGMKALFKVPKADIVPPKNKNAKQPRATSRKSKNADKD